MRNNSTSSSSSSNSSTSSKQKNNNFDSMFIMNNNVCDGVSSTQTNNGQQSTTSNGVDMDSQESEPAGDDNISKLLSSDQKVIDFTINNSESSTSLTSTNNVNLRILKQEMNNKLKYRTSLNNKNRKYQTKFSNENDASKQNFELKQMASTTLPAQSDSTKISSSFGLSSISSGSASSTNTTSSTSTTVSSTSTSSLNTSSELEEGINNNHLLNSVDSNDSSDDETTDEEKEKEAVDDDNGVNAVCNTHCPIISNNIKSNSVEEKKLKQPSFKHDKLTAQKLEKSKKKLNKIIEKFNKDYDNQLDKISDKATSLISDGSFYNCGLYQFISFLFVSIAWTIGNGWYAYVSVFTGYSPPHECDYKSMPNATINENDKECSALDINTNQTIKCTKWIYDDSQMKSTIITEYNFVCEKNYHFELAYALEQIGYIVGTLVFSFIADLVGRKPVLVSVLIAMSILGLIQQYIYNFVAYMIIGFIINSLACGLEAVCVTLVLEMFSTSKRTLFGIGIEVVWVLILAAMSPLAYFIRTWREIRLAIFAVLSLLAVCSFWLVQESIRWLISMSQINKAKLIINYISAYNKLDRLSTTDRKKIARFERKQKRVNKLFDQLEIYNRLNDSNNVSQDSSNVLKVPIEIDLIVSKSTQIDSNISNSESEQSSAQANKRKNDTVFTMFKNGRFRLYVLIMALNWFATALVYDGLTYLNNFIGENIFINWILMNLIELPAQFVCYLTISRYGRRPTISITLIAAGVILLGSLLEMIDFIDSLEGFKLAIFVLAKFIITQSYSGVIIHAPELFPTNLRSFGYGVCLFSGKITSSISPIISIYISKIMPRLPPIIYGVISILCGIVSLYIPETLNRPLPNSIDDVVKWPKKLSKEESKIVKELNKKEFDFVKQKIKFILSKFFKCNREGQATKNSDSPKSKIYNDIRSKNLKSSSILLINESEPLSKEKLIDSNPTITSNITATTNTTANTTTEANLNIKNNNNNIVENCESNKKQDEVNSNTFPSLSSSFSTNSLSSLNKLTNSNEESSTKLIKSSTIATSLSQPS
jgi:MFS family permease